MNPMKVQTSDDFISDDLDLLESSRLIQTSWCLTDIFTR